MSEGGYPGFPWWVEEQIMSITGGVVIGALGRHAVAGRQRIPIGLPVVIGW